MGVDIEKTAGVIGTLRRMTNRELATTIFLIVASVSAAFWVENRYAKIQDTQADLNRQQQEILQQQAKIDSIQTNLISVVNSLPPQVRREVLERTATNQALNPEPTKFVKPKQP